jgi:hypothetical protein
MQHEERLTELAANYRQATEKLAEARKELADAVRAASRDGMRQGDIIRATDHVWAREHYRRVLAEETP